MLHIHRRTSVSMLLGAPVLASDGAVFGRIREFAVHPAEDAAHVHSPAGGQGMNLGIQDAVALSGAVAAVLAGGPDTLLDDYDAARRPIAEQVVVLTDRLTRLATMPRVLRPIRNVLLGMVGRIPPATRALAMRLSGLVYR